MRSPRQKEAPAARRGLSCAHARDAHTAGHDSHQETLCHQIAHLGKLRERVVAERAKHRPRRDGRRETQRAGDLALGARPAACSARRAGPAVGLGGETRGQRSDRDRLEVRRLWIEQHHLFEVSYGELSGLRE